MPAAAFLSVDYGEPPLQGGRGRAGIEMAFCTPVTSAPNEKSGRNSGDGTGRAPSTELSQKLTPRYSTERIWWGAGFLFALSGLVVVATVSRQAWEQLQSA